MPKLSWLGGTFVSLLRKNADLLVRWCERLVNTKVGDKHLRLVFTSYSIVGDVVMLSVLLHAE